MPAISKDQAIEQLTKEVEENLPADELLEVYNELFPEDPHPTEHANEDRSPLVQRIVDHLHSDLAVDEMVDVWNLVFPKHRNVWYEEEEERFHYNEESEPLHAG
jgi:hypothetical protein